MIDATAVTDHSNEPDAPEPAVTAGAGVQDHDRPAAGRPVLLADHELAAVRGRGPVDPAQVVAVAVAADGHVVLAVQGHHVRDGALGPDAVTAGVSAAERLHARQHGDLGGPGQRGRDGRQPERVAHPESERAELVAPADVRPDGVGDLPALAGLHPRQHEARPVTEHVVHPLLGQLHRAAPGRGVLEDDLHPGGLVDGQP